MFRLFPMIILFSVTAPLAFTTYGQSQQPAAPAPSGTGSTALAQSLRHGDRLLFVGDDLTQQMFYTRAVAAALLAMKPELDLRFFNGGRDGATVQSTTQTIDSLLELSQPTIVFLCFGLNDGRIDDLSEPIATAFKKNLATLIQKVESHTTVRRVVVLGPSPIPSDLSEKISPTSYNWTLRDLSLAAQEVAQAEGADFIDLFDHMKRVYLASLHTGGEPLSFNGRLPTETGHTVLASIILKGIGCQSHQLDRIGWSPIPPPRMGRVRSALAMTLQPVSLKTARRSRELYIGIQLFDEAFFRFWRLSKRRTAQQKTRLRTKSNQAWDTVKALASEYPQAQPNP